jgi:enoyl-CoA hydratase
MELALASDLVIAGEGATFGLPEVTRGLVARAGGLLRMARALPTARAMEIALTGGRFDAATVLDWGLINRVVPDGTALQAAIDLGSAIASNAPLAVVASKRVIRESANWRGEEAFQRQAIITDPVFESDDANEGALAFLQKRAPSWTGR